MTPLLSLDLHRHLLPGIDDGAKHLDDTAAIAQALVERGIHRVVASSHIQMGVYPNSRDILLPLVAAAQAHLDREGIALEIVPGAEIRLDPELCCPETWLTIGDADRHMLVELPPGQPMMAMIEAQLFGLLARGITPIIAHPERMGYLQKDPDRLSAWVEQGVLAQGTLCVLAGAAAEPTVRTFETFLARGLLHFMGTDAHAVDRRLRDLDRAADRLAALVGEENALLIRIGNPSALLSGAAIRRPEPIIPIERTSFVSKLLAPFKRSLEATSDRPN